MRFFHSGDLGDLIYALPSIRGLCAADGTLGIIYLGNRDWTRSIWNPGLLSVIEPLLLAQDYIESVSVLPRHEVPPTPFTDFSTFRNGGYKTGDTIYERQRRWVGAPRIDLSLPWLAVPYVNHADPPAFTKNEGRIVINRTERWLGLGFPWKTLLARFRGQAVFIGLGQEYQAFCREFEPIPFVPTANLLEAAQVLDSSGFFIGNQSAIGAIANGLGMPMLSEACLYASDCFFPRANAHYCLDGALDLEILGIPFKTSAREPSTPNERLEAELFLPRCRKALSISLQVNSCALSCSPA